MREPESNPGLERVHHQLRASGVRKERPNRLLSGIHTRGYLPHVKREGAAYFVTFRLLDSLPREVLLELERQHAETESRLAPGDTVGREEANRELRRCVERYLDLGTGECYLHRPDIARMVAQALLFFHEKQYVLSEWVIMPNHVHLVLWPMANYTLSAILQSRKRYTARRANLILGRSGESFWEHESYDHWIRSDEEKARIRRYIRNNPVKARLCRAPEEWQWGSAWKASGGFPTPDTSL